MISISGFHRCTVWPLENNRIFFIFFFFFVRFAKQNQALFICKKKRKHEEKKQRIVSYLRWTKKACQQHNDKSSTNWRRKILDACTRITVLNYCLTLIELYSQCKMHGLFLQLFSTVSDEGWGMGLNYEMRRNADSGEASIDTYKTGQKSSSTGKLLWQARVLRGCEAILFILFFFFSTCMCAWLG